MKSIGIIGDFDGRPSHLATTAALEHSAAKAGAKVRTEWIPTPSLVSSTDAVKEFDALLCAPGSPYQSLDGAMNGIRFARERRLPFLGTCGGFQAAVIEFARNVLHVTAADHAELSGVTERALVVPLSCPLPGTPVAIRLADGSRARQLYGRAEISERFRCAYGLSSAARGMFERSDLKISGHDREDQVVIVELRDRPFYLATLFQPQLASAAGKTHPLIDAFLAAAHA